VILIDANLLLFAYQPRANEHEASRRWLEATLEGSELIRFAWLTIWAFLRISTNGRVFERPLSGVEARAAVSAWLARPSVGIAEPGERHWTILGELMNRGQASGPLVMDAAIAALAIEHGAILCTTDRDFARFPTLKWRNPLV
jgi:toxin-antitoxin system PIN domain toxin